MMKQLIFRLPSRLMFLVVGLMLSLGAFAQITVNGHVKDATGEDIIGATVRIVGQQGGTVTDFNGNFQLKAKAGAELQIFTFETDCFHIMASFPDTLCHFFG